MKNMKELQAELDKSQQKVQLLMEMLRQSEQSKEAPANYLFRKMTLKQHAVLQMLFRAARNDEIADRLRVAVPTAKGLVRTLGLNAGLRNRAALVARYKPLFDLMGEEEYKAITGGLSKKWDEQYREDDPINEAIWRKKHEHHDPDD